MPANNQPAKESHRAPSLKPRGENASLVHDKTTARVWMNPTAEN